MVEHATERVIAVTPRSTLDSVLDQLRALPPGAVTVALQPLSTLFSTPDHFRALDGVRLARSITVTIVVDDPHRTGLALAFGYHVRARTTTARPPYLVSAAAPAISPNGTYALPGPFVVEDILPERADTETRAPSRRSFAWLWEACLIAVFILAAGVGGMALLVARVHTADIVVTPAEQSFSRVVPFAVSVSPTDDPNTIQTTVFATTIAREGDAPATGKATVPDGTATGAMTFRSRADGATTIKAGTTLKGPKDVGYTLVADVVVPGLNFVRGQLGEVSGQVRATQPGPSGNLGAGFSNRYTDNVTYISGEIGGGTEKQVPVVTDDDIATVRSKMESDLRLHALSEVNAGLAAGVTALNDYLTLGTATTTAQPASGTQADSVHVRIALAAQVPIYRNADFDALINRRLDDVAREASGGGDGAQTIIAGSIVKAKPVFVDVQGPLVRYFATVTGKTRSIITDADIQRVCQQLAGKDNGAATHLLTGTPLIDHARIAYGPSWLPTPLRTRMPRDSSRIRVRVEVA